MRVRDVAVREVTDSRGNPTVEISLRHEAGQWFAAPVPAVTSKAAALPVMVPTVPRPPPLAMVGAVGLRARLPFRKSEVVKLPVVNAPVEAVVAPIGVELMPVEVAVISTFV